MAAGGIYDQVGGGFARYAVDATWTVPHFEKMLYDNALLARAYLHGWQVTRERRFAEVCVETLDWALRELRGPEGGFCSALDADSDGVEGKFYVWTATSCATRSARAGRPGASPTSGATDAGNFEHGANVLEARGPAPERVAGDPPQAAGGARAAGSARARRQAPDRLERADDQRRSPTPAPRSSARTTWTAARACAAFLLEHLRDDDGNLLRTWKDGRAMLPAYLEDHAYLLQALLVLYEATFEERWYVEAVALADTMIERFGDPERGGFFTTAADVPHLVSRRKDLEDAPTPSGNSAAALGLLRLARLSGNAEYERQAAGVLALHAAARDAPPDRVRPSTTGTRPAPGDPSEVAIVGAGGAGSLSGALRTRYLPHVVLAGTDRDSTEGTAVPLLEGRTTIDGRQAAYVCERFTCQLPVTEVEALVESLSASDESRLHDR